MPAPTPTRNNAPCRHATLVPRNSVAAAITSNAIAVGAGLNEGLASASGNGWSNVAVDILSVSANLSDGLTGQPQQLVEIERIGHRERERTVSVARPLV